MKRATIAGIVLGATMGLALGTGLYTFVYAKGGSYLTNDPRACVNCHIMQEQYDGWAKSSHRSVATCNDCHAPHNLIGKYWTKAQNGFWHSFYFTTGSFHEPIQIKKRNLEITEQACQKCHDNITQAIATDYSGPHATRAGESVSCVRCHRSVGHLH